MGRGKDEFIRQTGGFRLGETKEEFSARAKEIKKLEKEFIAGVYRGEELERVQRRLCELKGINFDDKDDDD